MHHLGGVPYDSLELSFGTNQYQQYRVQVSDEETTREDCYVNVIEYKRPNVKLRRGADQHNHYIGYIKEDIMFLL